MLDKACLFEILVRLPYIALQNLLKVYPKVKHITLDNSYFDERWKKYNTKLVTGTEQINMVEWHEYTAEVDITTGLKHGLYTTYDADTKHRRTTYHYKQGKRHGVETTYNKLNQIKRQINWVNDERQGIEQTWDKYGNLKATAPYVDNCCEGQAWVYKDGERSLTEYRHDIAEGKDIEWFDNGQRKSEENYRDGRQHGRFIKWFPSGAIRSVVTYNRGEVNN
jgi:antitoxin component YwqK of YwqJK toxin-antitoxin module